MRERFLTLGMQVKADVVVAAQIRRLEAPNPSLLIPLEPVLRMPEPPVGSSRPPGQVKAAQGHHLVALRTCVALTGRGGSAGCGGRQQIAT